MDANDLTAHFLRIIRNAEGHTSDMSRETTRGPGADRLDGARAAQERCLVRVT